MKKAVVFGKRITQLRERSGLNKKQFAECIGVSSRTLLQIERGEGISHRPIDIYSAAENLKIPVKELSKWLCF